MTRAFRNLLAGALLALWCAAVSGLAISFASEWMLILHLISAAGGAVPVVAFLRLHWWSRRRQVGQHPNARLGYVALGSLAVLTLSGIALLIWTNVAALRWLHLGGMIVLGVDLSVHTAWRLRRRLFQGSLHPGDSRARRRTRGAAMYARWTIGAMLVLISIAGMAWTARVIAGPLQPTSDRVMLAHASLGAHELPSAKNCASCHADIAELWQGSAHGQAALDPYYQALTAVFIQERGIAAAQYCATCHNPIGLMQGEIDAAAAQRTAAAPQTNAYQARALGVALPISDRAAEGVTCVLCHQAASIAESPANGSLMLYAGEWLLPTNPVARLALRAAPDPHARSLLPAAIVSAQMCGSCHNLQLPDNGMKLEPTYDEWLASPYPEQNKTCQSCHMPDRSARLVNSGLPELVSAHGGLPGAPSSLPSMSNNPELLRTAASLQVDARWSSPVEMIATVTITNSGAGHFLPTGADDLRQLWLETTVRDSGGTVVWQSGASDEYGMIDPSTVRFGKVLGDAQGNPIDLHRFWQTTQILSDTRLAPMETRRVPYAVPIPVEAGQQPYRVTVRLLYRDVSPSFAEFALERPVPDLATVEMAKAELTVEPR